MNNPTGNGVVAAALNYAARGWPVVPLHSTVSMPSGEGSQARYCTCGNHRCSSPGKHPRTPHGLKDATTDQETIASWWQKWPRANVGILTGAAAGILVIDIDPRHGGDESLAALEAEHGGLIPTLEAATGGGGRHLIFRHPGRKVGNRANLRPGIDVRGDGGYIVAPPSHHASGGRYAWSDGGAPDQRQTGELPGWFCQLLTRPEPALRPPASATCSVEALGQLMNKAERYVANVPGAVEGGRNVAAFNLAGHLAAFVTEAGERLTESQIIDVMRPWNHRGVPPLTDAELARTVRSAMMNGTPRAAHVVHATPVPTGERTRDKVPKYVERFTAFPVSVLPAPVRGYVQAVADATGTDPSYAATAALVTLAGVVGNRAAALVKPGWVEPAVLWGALAGRSGSVKTHVLKLVIKPLTDLYKMERRCFAELQQKHHNDKVRYDVQLAEWKRSQQKGPPTDPPQEPEEPREKRVLVSDITVEKLGALLEENPLGLLLARDELAGWVGSFDRYAAGGKGCDQASWLSMSDAGPLTIDRKSNKGTLFIERAAVSIVGTIQPGTLARVFGSREREAGLLARVLVASPPDRPALWNDAELGEEQVAAWGNLIFSLLGIPAGEDETGDPRPRLISFSPEAKHAYIQWHDQLACEVADMPGDDLAAHYSKLKGSCARIALLFTCVEVATRGSGIATISADGVQRAIAVTDWYKNEARRVYANLGEDEEDRDRRRLAEWISRKGGEITTRLLQQSMRCYRTSKDADAALSDLVNAGYGDWENRQPTSRGGRPTRVFRLHADTAVYETAVEAGVDKVFVDAANKTEPPPDNVAGSTGQAAGAPASDPLSDEDPRGRVPQPNRPPPEGIPPKVWATIQARKAATASRDLGEL